ncbi:hypothetical protein Tco_0759714 [Tanacetum coccineum]
MRNIRMTMPNIQLNSKFVNNMSPEWDRFVTAVKLNKGLKETNHEQLYAYLKQHEKHAAQDRLIIERMHIPAKNDQPSICVNRPNSSQSSHFSLINILLLNKKTLNYNNTSIPAEMSQILSPGYTKLMKYLQTLPNKMALLAHSHSSRRLLRTNIQLRTSSNTQKSSNYSRRSGCGSECPRATESESEVFCSGKCIELRGTTHSVVNNRRVNTFDVDVDNQRVQDLALNEDNIFQVDECDAFDSDVDDETTAKSIFMANLSLVGPTNPQAGPSNASILSEVHILENAIDYSVTNQDEHEIHNEVQHANIIDSTSVDMGQDRGPTAFMMVMNFSKAHHVPIIVPSSEEELELAETTRNKLHVKIK